MNYIFSSSDSSGCVSCSNSSSDGLEAVYKCHLGKWVPWSLSSPMSRFFSLAFLSLLSLVSSSGHTGSGIIKPTYDETYSDQVAQINGRRVPKRTFDMAAVLEYERAGSDEDFEAPAAFTGMPRNSGPSRSNSGKARRKKARTESLEKKEVVVEEAKVTQPSVDDMQEEVVEVVVPVEEPVVSAIRRLSQWESFDQANTDPLFSLDDNRLELTREARRIMSQSRVTDPLQADYESDLECELEFESDYFFF